MNFIPITDVCDFQGGTQPPKEEWDSQLKPGYVRMLQIRDFTQKKLEHIEYVKISNKIKTCEADDILIGRYGASIGKILTGLPGAYNVAIVKTTPDEKKLNKSYLYYILKDSKFQSFIGNIGGRAAQAGFNKEDLKNFQIPLPPLPEQIHIANVLSGAEALIAKRKESLALLDAYLKSVFLEMFGDPVRNEKGWGVKQFSEIVAPDCPLTYGIVQPGEEFKDGVIIVRPVDLTSDIIHIDGLKRIDPKIERKYIRTRLKGGELLMCVRGTTGIVSIAGIDLKGANVTRGITPIWFNDSFNNWFAMAQIKSQSMQKKIQEKTYGIALKQINLRDVRIIEFIAPPLTLQNQFAAVVEKVEALKETYQKSLVELEHLYGSLSQRAFRGELGGETQHAAAKNPKAEKEPAIKNKTSITEASDSLPSSNIIEFKPTNVDYYKRTVLAAEIVWQLHKEATLGHLKLQKLMYLCIKSADMQLPVNFLKQAMGPFDPSLMRSIDKQLKDKKWFQYEPTQALKYRKLEKAGEHQKDFIKYYGNQKDQIHYLITKFKTTSSDKVEIVATLYACYENILNQKETFSEILLFQRFYEWSEHKKEFDELEVKKVFNRMKEVGVVPKG
ncbi:restriction endonuclease subunit S [Leptospira kanakyensis]|uniref:Restriction endonuclease subunit S n=1 Tax=Leptospira kanakyensis TaxID=2484968 RepID=A0A6N4QMY5_9LEPT|nr:restriction endonuclease subunit S [Leptospira kanakyensis]TGK55579.1 restriction endonuclease subunit S [Leptospira kanakyensis]TGK61115.1 restriction endonuclease subunit S [Leptospira kanakyensis]TGK76413.1 restriction endonuclease subunit S [Leptospira kanakyensis]